KDPDDDGDEKRLYKQPTFEGNGSTGPYGITLTTDIKINRDSDGFTHNEFELQITGSDPITGTINRSSYNGSTVEIAIPTNSSATQTRQVERFDDYYLIKNVVIENIAFNTSSSHQV